MSHMEPLCLVKLEMIDKDVYNGSAAKLEPGEDPGEFMQEDSEELEQVTGVASTVSLSCTI